MIGRKLSLLRKAAQGSAGGLCLPVRINNYHWGKLFNWLNCFLLAHPIPHKICSGCHNQWQITQLAVHSSERVCSWTKHYAQIPGACHTSVPVLLQYTKHNIQAVDRHTITFVFLSNNIQLQVCSMVPHVLVDKNSL